MWDLQVLPITNGTSLFLFPRAGYAIAIRLNSTKMVKLNIYGRGRSLRMAIMFTCQLAFIFFGAYTLYSGLENRTQTANIQNIGYDQGVFSGIVGNDEFLDIVHHPSAGILGIIVSIYNLGCFTGTIVSFVISDRIGPRKSMWFAMAWIIVCFSISFSHIYNESNTYMTRIGRSNITNNRILKSPVTRCALHHWYRYRYRNYRRTSVPIRTMRSQETRKIRLQRAAFCRGWYCYCLLV